MPFLSRRSSQVMPAPPPEVEGSSHWLNPWRFSTGRSSSSGGSSPRDSARSSVHSSRARLSASGAAAAVHDPLSVATDSSGAVREAQELGPYGRRGSSVPKVFVEELCAGRPQEPEPRNSRISRVSAEPPRRSSRISACSSTGGTGGAASRGLRNSGREGSLTDIRRTGSLVELLNGHKAEAETQASLPFMCTCGEIFMEDSVYCRRCGMKRASALELPPTCPCGEDFTEDSRFCHKCGRKRKGGKGSAPAARSSRPMNRRMSMSILEPRRKQMRILAQEISDAQVVHLSSDQTTCSRIFQVLRFVLTCQWIGGARRFLRAVADKDFIQTPIANSICGSVIILNAALIGFEMEVNNGEHGSMIFWFIVETAFLVFFIGELLLRLRSLGLRSIRDPVTLFDSLLIVLGMMDTWVAGAMVVSQSENGSDALFKITLLRLVRLARMIRVLRVIKLFRYFRELVLLGRGIMAAVQALFWSGVLILLILYLCSVLTASGYIAMSEGEDPNTDMEQDLAEWFGSIGSSLMTLFQVMTLEEWHIVLRTSNEMWNFAWIFFVPFILIANVALLNAVTAVVVENVWSIAQSEASFEAKRSEKLRARALAKFKALFQSIDVDHNAFLDQDEFKAALNQPFVMETLLHLGIARCEADELFELCDVDGNRVLSVAEFVDGCLRVIGPGKSKHLLQVQYDLLRAHRSLRGQVCELAKNLKVVVKALSKVHGVKMPRSLDLAAMEAKTEEEDPGTRKTSPPMLTMVEVTAKPSETSDGEVDSPRRNGERLPSVSQPNALARRISAPVVSAVRSAVGRAMPGSLGNPSGAKPDGTASASGTPRQTTLQPGRLKISILSSTGLQKPGTAVSPDDGLDVYCACEVPCCSGSTLKFRTWAVRDASPRWDHVEDVEDYAIGESVSFSVFSEATAAGSGLPILGTLLGKAWLTGAQLQGNGFDGELKLKEASAGCPAALRVRVELTAASSDGSSPEPRAAAIPDEDAPTARAVSPPMRPASPPVDPAPPEAELKLLVLSPEIVTTSPCQTRCNCGGLITSARQEQTKLNQLVEELLEEAQLLHGRVSEVASLKWESPESRLSSAGSVRSRLRPSIIRRTSTSP